MATEYVSNVQQTSYVFVMSTVYSDDICLPYNYGIYFSTKNFLSDYPVYFGLSDERIQLPAVAMLKIE